MNTSNCRKTLAKLLVSTAAVVALIAGLTLPSRAAEPMKGAERLMLLGAAKPAVAGVAGNLDRVSHSACPACQTIRSTKPRAGAKGAEVLFAGGNPTVGSSIHGCNACSSTIDVAGHGKAKTTQVSHSCTMKGSASASCCI